MQISEQIVIMKKLDFILVASFVIVLLYVLVDSMTKTVTKKQLAESNFLWLSKTAKQAKIVYVDYDTMRKRLGLPIVGDDFTAKREQGYLYWSNPNPTPPSSDNIEEFTFVGPLPKYFKRERGEVLLSKKEKIIYVVENTGSNYLTWFSLYTKVSETVEDKRELTHEESKAITAKYGKKVLNY